jgi:hypothetical protein
MFIAEHKDNKNHWVLIDVELKERGQIFTTDIQLIRKYTFS